jgi:transcriptional regulator with XRE-family HTH domain
VERTSLSVDWSASVGAQLRRARHEKGLSIGALADRAQVSAASISLIERGMMCPSLGKLLGLVRALGVSMDELLALGGVHGEPPC